LRLCIRWGKGSHLSGDRNTEEQREGMGKKCDKLNRRKDGNTNREEGRRASVLATETTGETHRGDRWGSSFVNSTKGSMPSCTRGNSNRPGHRARGVGPDHGYCGLCELMKTCGLVCAGPPAEWDGRTDGGREGMVQELGIGAWCDEDSHLSGERGRRKREETRGRL
jgi:hypothetical protein